VEAATFILFSFIRVTDGNKKATLEKVAHFDGLMSFGIKRD
jgi:hypothetical protein